jgi:hypothetical protein
MRHQLCSAIALALLTAGTSATSWAQDSTTWRGFELRPYAGTYVPMGSQRDVFHDGLLVGAEGAYDLGANFHVIGDVSWTRPSTKLVSVDSRTNIYQYGAGVELGVARDIGGEWMLRPFVDVGGGVRRYDYTSATLVDRTRGLAFAAIGTELGFGRAAIRLEGRDNVFSFEAPTSDATRATRNDVGLTLGLAYHL